MKCFFVGFNRFKITRLPAFEKRAKKEAKIYWMSTSTHKKPTDFKHLADTNLLV
jgi:hypothetical protein